MGHATFQKTPISQSNQVKSRCPGTYLNVTPRMKSKHEGALTPWLHPLKKAAGSKYNLTSGLTTHEQLERQAEFHASTQDRVSVPTMQRHQDQCQKWSGTLRSPP